MKFGMLKEKVYRERNVKTGGHMKKEREGT